jgi:hypothetical protein
VALLWELWRTALTILVASELDILVGHYLVGMGVTMLVDSYGIHRATVFSHLHRRNEPSRRPRLGNDSKAEAVRLTRARVSMRAIGRRMGVPRGCAGSSGRGWTHCGLGRWRFVAPCWAADGARDFGGDHRSRRVSARRPRRAATVGDERLLSPVRHRGRGSWDGTRE